MNGRRRFLRILAAYSGVAALNGVTAIALKASEYAPTRTTADWSGIALGADARIQIAHVDATEGERLLRQCRAEIEMVESLFSLYRTDSTLRQLNSNVVLHSPPETFVELLHFSNELYEATEGYFDPSVQPLWDLHAKSVRPNATDDKSLEEEAAACRTRIGFHNVGISRDAVILKKAGMALTLNGIAQGYLTDRITALLRRAGIKSALVETGETYALGERPNGGVWRIGIPEPFAHTRLIRTVSLCDRAIATSAPSGTVFDPAGRYHHLFNPHSGRCANTYASVSVTAPSAAMADALSTSFAAMPPDMMLTCATTMTDVGVFAVAADGQYYQLGTI